MKEYYLEMNEVLKLVSNVCELIKEQIIIDDKNFGFDTNFSYVSFYGIPQGGIPVAFLIVNALNDDKIFTQKHRAHVTFDIMSANFIIDDLIDSGKTKHDFLKYHPLLQHKNCDGNHYFALINREQSGMNEYWLKFPWETDIVRNDISAIDIPIRLLQYIGEDVNREGLIDTPQRVVNTWKELFKGYDQDIQAIFKTFENPKYDQMVILSNIEFYSTCEHHLLPFFGKCHIGYLPDKKIVGISKLARLVDIFAKRLQLQERLTTEIAGTIQENLSPLGVGVIMTAQHMCVTSRGVQKQEALLTTSALFGQFLLPEVKAEFLNLIELNSKR